MTPERWAAAQALFESALAAPAEARAAIVDGAGDPELADLVRGLLDADAEERAGQPLDAVVRQAMADASISTGGGPLERFGPYKIIRMLGEGGMGAVYLAERDDDEFLQQVAIKVTRGLLDPERVRQFRAERQMLAWLEHPNIARLLDGGTTSQGLPYLVMEHVEGVPIDQHCDQAQLDITARLTLFLDVCDAVSHAHRSLIVHRDIKPNNILVTSDGVPKLLDFGIARLALEAGPDAPSAPPQMMTPYYASPEVVRGGQITTAADVYALGVLLHELVTGTRPLRFRTMTSEEVERVVCHVEPRPASLAALDRDGEGPSPGDRARFRRTTPRALAARLAGDLDAIIAMALHKQADKRYVTVEALAVDVRRTLERRPVSARPRTWTYVTTRLIGRHRWVTATAALAIAAVVSAAVVFSLQAARLAAERDRTARERDTAQQVSRFLTDLFEVSNPNLSGAGVSARDLLDRGAERIDAELAARPLVQASLLATIGTAYAAHGDYARALQLRQRALDLRRSTLGADDLDTVTAMDDVAESYRVLDRLDDAEAMHRAALAAKRRLAAPRPSIARSLHHLGVTLGRRGRYAEAEPLLREALTIRRSLSGDDHPDTVDALNELALLLHQQGDLASAEPLFRAAVDSVGKRLGRTHADYAEQLDYLASLLADWQRFDEAERLQRESLAIRLANVGSEHETVADVHHSLARTLLSMGKADAAEPLVRRALEVRGRVRPEGHVAAALDRGLLGEVLAARGRSLEAEPLLLRVPADLRTALGENHPAVGDAEVVLSAFFRRTVRPHLAEPHARRAVAITRVTLPATHWKRAVADMELATVLAALQRRREAAEVLGPALSGLTLRFGERDARVQDAQALLASLTPEPRRAGAPE